MWFASPRLWAWETRLKLLLMASLAYAFLPSFLDEDRVELRVWLLRCWCHRTGKRYRQITVPLYRLRREFSRLWQAYPPFALLSADTSLSPDPPPTNWSVRLYLFLLLLTLSLLLILLNICAKTLG